MNILDLIYPPKCVHCGSILREKEIEPLCDGICFPKWVFEKFGINDNYLAYYDKNANSVARSMVLKAKNSYNSRLYRYLADEMAELIASRMRVYNDTVIVNVPRSKKKKRETGIDQAERLSKLIAKKLKIQYANVLIHKGNTQQKLLNAQERIENVENAYEIKNNVTGKNIILFDDVITTGATINKCRELLLHFGAKDVTIFSICRTKGEY
ncbi:MAG: hypothetical protein FWF15_01725 [Oscillospiraceae bacterium]|nr:hypothetical protein [Oscillospiraceae bacterium]